MNIGLSIYKVFVSPLLHSLVFFGGCRYHPSCSRYFFLAVKKYGLKKGLTLSLARLISCNPYSKRDLIDLP